MYKAWNKNISGENIGVFVWDKTHIYREFNVFMRDNENKKELFEMLQVVQHHPIL